MNQEEAKTIARDYLSKCIKLVYCHNPPQGLYRFDLYLGSANYIAVSKATGTARYLGVFGE